MAKSSQCIPKIFAKECMIFFLSLLDKGISDDNHALWAMSCDWYAQYLLNNGRYRAALEQFEKAKYIGK